MDPDISFCQFSMICTTIIIGVVVMIISFGLLESETNTNLPLIIIASVSSIVTFFLLIFLFVKICVKSKETLLGIKRDDRSSYEKKVANSFMMGT